MCKCVGSNDIALGTSEWGFVSGSSSFNPSSSVLCRGHLLRTANRQLDGMTTISRYNNAETIFGVSNPKGYILVSCLMLSHVAHESAVISRLGDNYLSCSISYF